MRLVFMGTPDFSVHVLQDLVAADHDIAAVYSQPPRPAGRGKKPRPSPVQKWAEDHGLQVRTPLNFKDKSDVDAFAGLQAEAAVVVAYGLILPQAVLDAPERGCFNIHASLLPRWRGAAPIQRAIMAGDTETGVCIMQMEAGLDTGPVLNRATTPITADDTAASLHDRLSEIGGQLMVETLERLDTLPAIPQAETGVTYAKKIDKSEARIDWSRPAEEVDHLIRGISPFPGAWFEIDGQRIKALFSKVVDANAPAGTVLDNMTIACGTGAVRLLRVQKAGKSAQDAEIFLRGNRIPVGSVLT